MSPSEESNESRNSTPHLLAFLIGEIMHFRKNAFKRICFLIILSAIHANASAVPLNDGEEGVYLRLSPAPACGSFLGRYALVDINERRMVSGSIEIENMAEGFLESFRNRLPNNCGFQDIVIQGRITNHTSLNVGLALEILETQEVGALFTYVYLDSQGGLIESAMSIGNMIAQHELPVGVPYRSRCFSSCVLILAAGKSRMPIGSIGIHRPFSYEISTQDINFSQYLSAYEQVSVYMRSYLAQFGVSPRLVDDMNVIASDDIKILSPEEIESYGLGSDNVAFKEFEKSRIIEHCGIDFYNLRVEHTQKHLSCSLSRPFLQCWKEADAAFPGYSDKNQACLRALR